MKLALYGTMLFAALVVAGTPFAAADCVEGAGSMACVDDYSNDDSTFYVVEAYAVDGTMVAFTVFEGKALVGGSILSADAFVDSPTTGTGVFAGVYGNDGVPSDGTYETGEVWVEAWDYDSTYEYAYVQFKDSNSDGLPDSPTFGSSTGLLP